MKNRKVSIIATFALTLTVVLTLALNAQASGLSDLDIQNSLDNDVLLGLNSRQALPDLDARTLVLEKTLGSRLLVDKAASNGVLRIEKIDLLCGSVSGDLQDDVRDIILSNKLQVRSLEILPNKSLQNLKIANLDSPDLLGGFVSRNLSLELLGEISGSLGSILN